MTFPEEEGLVPSTLMAAHCLQLSITPLPGARTPPLAFKGNRHANGAQTYIQTNTHI